MYFFFFFLEFLKQKEPPILRDYKTNQSNVIWGGLIKGFQN